MFFNWHVRMFLSLALFVFCTLEVARCAHHREGSSTIAPRPKHSYKTNYSPHKPLFLRSLEESCAKGTYSFMTEGKHDYAWGKCKRGDRLIINSKLKMDGIALRTVKQTVSYTDFNATIHFIYLIDQQIRGNGGFATLVRGGIGSESVTVFYESQRNRGLEFNVFIFGQ